MIGFFTFGGVPATVMTVAGVSLNAFGGTLYTYIKYREKKSAGVNRLPETTKEKTYHVEPLNGFNGTVYKKHGDESYGEKDAILNIRPGA